MTLRYRVLISGRRLSGKPLAELTDRLAEVFRLAPAQAAQMTSGKPMIVAKEVAADAADRLLERLQGLDLEARKEALPAPAGVPATATVVKAPAPASDELFALTAPPVPIKPPSPPPSTAADNAPAATPSALAIVGDAVVCPKCGEEQPKRTLCRQCGLDMPRYQAAQEESRREALAERQAALDSRRSPASATTSEPEAITGENHLVGFDLSSRLGRLDYLTSSLFSTLVWMLCIWLAVLTGKTAFAGLGMLLSVIVCLRCVALRLHDTGRSGWLALLIALPLIGALMALALLVIPGEDEDNEYGPVAASKGAFALIPLLVITAIASTAMFRHMASSPETSLKYMAAMSIGQGKEAVAASDDDDDDGPAPASPQAHYAASNRVDIYVIDGCDSCSQMVNWLNGQGLHPTVYAVDTDEQAAERLHSIAGSGQIMLPTLEINGKVLPGNPNLNEVQRHLRRE